MELQRFRSIIGVDLLPEHLPIGISPRADQ